MPEPLPSSRGVAPKATAATPVSSWVAPLVDAADAFCSAYARHLNHHDAACTKAWQALRQALDAVPPR